MRRGGLIAQREWSLVGGLFLVGLVSRLVAQPASFWEWDEIGFARALHHFDLAAHSPHPPGFPVFIAMGRLAWSVWRDDLAALVSVNLVFSIFLGAVLYQLYREILDERGLAFGGALLGLFTPAIWIYSGVPRSDNPALVTGLLVVWLALWGRRSARALLLGALLLGIGMGIRVTIIPFAGPVFGLVLLGRLVRREWGVAAGAVLLAVGGWLSWYLPFMRLVGWAEYNQIMRVQSAFISEHDTIWSSHWTLGERLSGFFLTTWGEAWIAWTIYLAAGLGVIALLWRRRGPALGWLAATFIPVLIFTLVINTPTAAVVYSLPFLPLFTILATCGFVLTGRGLVEMLGQVGPRWLTEVGLAIPLLLALLLGVWSYPAVRLIHRGPSPTDQAANYLRRRFDPQKDKLYFDERLVQHATYYFRSRGEAEIEQRLPDEELALNLVNPENRYYQRIYQLTDQPVAGTISQHFHWPGGVGVERLRPLSFGRYFDLYLSEPARNRDYAWASGWFDAEQEGLKIWRWMGREGHVALFKPRQQMRLRVVGRLPDAARSLRLQIDGRAIGSVAGPEVDFSTVVTAPDTPGSPASGQLWSLLTLEADQTFIPSRSEGGSDQRELGFQCFGISWEEIEGSAARRVSAEDFLREGWLPLQIAQPRSWRWAERRATVALPPLPSARGRLRVILATPTGGTTIRLSIDGETIGSLSPAAGEMASQSWVVASDRCPGRACQLTFESSAGGTGRAFKVTSLTWHPE